MGHKELLRRIARNRQEEFPFPDNLEAYLDDFVPNLLLKSETLQRAFAVSDQEMESLYEEAYAFYEQNKFVQAADLFRWLVLLNPYVERSWMGLAACQQLLKLYENALKAYAIATLLDKNDPLPHFHAFECYVALNDHVEALKALDAAYQCAKKHQPQYNALLEKIEHLRERLCQQV